MDTDVVTTLPYASRMKALFDYFAQRRAVQAVGASEHANVWEVFRYAETMQVLADHDSFRSDKRALIPEDQPHLAMVARGNFIGVDPPLHTQFRALVSGAFTPRMIARLEPSIETYARSTLDAALQRADGSFDLTQDYSSRLSAAVIAELFGIPDADHEMFWGWSDGLLGSRPFGELGVVDEVAMRKVADLVRDASDYAHAHIRSKRSNPGADLTSSLTQMEIDGVRLSDDEIMGVIGMFLIAGHMSTSLLIGNTVMCLDEHPEAMAAVRAEPRLLPSAIEEVLRWRPPLIRDQRVAARDVQVGGTVIPQGASVCVWLVSANRDERQFADGERFDIQRDPNSHRAFGHGIHYCLGAALARLETRIAVRTVLDRLPALAVLRDGPVEFHRSIGLLGPVRLPVSYGTEVN